MDRTLVTRNLPAWALAALAVVAPLLYDAADAAIATLFTWARLPDDVETAGTAFLAAVVAFVLGYFGVQRGTIPVDPAARSTTSPLAERGAIGVVEALLIVLVIVIILVIVGVI